MPLPLEFTIFGPPVSAQARRRERLEQWRGEVTAVADSHWGRLDPDNGPIAVTVIYFSHGRPFDLDNVPKPILDAMKGLVYTDDNQVTDLVCRKRNLNDGMEIITDLASLDEAFSSGQEFLHIVVESAPQQEAVSWYRTRLLLRSNS